MSETGFVCPKCGNTERFMASSVILYCKMCIDEYGWDWSYGGSCDSELPEFALMECCSCGHEDNWHMFEEGYAED